MRVWHVAHSGAVLHRLLLGDRAASVLVWSLVASAYSFTLGVVIVVTVGARVGLRAVFLGSWY